MADRNRLYSLLLAFIVILDSIVTIMMGTEKNPILLYIMKELSLSLSSMMIWRVVVLWAAIYFLYKQSIKIKNIILCYVLLYGTLVVVL